LGTEPAVATLGNFVRSDELGDGGKNSYGEGEGSRGAGGRLSEGVLAEILLVSIGS